MRAEEVTRLLRYDYDLGCLVWRERSAEEHGNTPKLIALGSTWNKHHAGKPVRGVIQPSGYVTFFIKKKCFRYHRVVWCCVHGEWPEGDIDHINGDRADNRIENLRSVSRAENCRNLGLASRNKTGVLGVVPSANGKRFVAAIKAGSRTVYLGTFDTLEEARLVRERAQKQFGFHENHGKKIAVLRPANRSDAA